MGETGSQGGIIDSEVQIEAHGVDGTAGVLHAPLPMRRPTDLAGALWLQGDEYQDVHVAFRGRVVLETAARVTLDVLGVSAFRAWLDGDPLLDGPMRFAPAAPEYQTVEVRLGPGTHVIAAHVRSDALTTRLMANIPGFWWCRVMSDGESLPVFWRARRMHEYQQTNLRISPLQGWVEWTDQPVDPAWRSVDFDDRNWSDPQVVDVSAHGVGMASESSLQLPPWPTRPLSTELAGVFRETFTGYALDDLAVQAALVDLDPQPGDDADGIWARYDLGRIRIGRVRLDVSTAGGGQLDISFGERLSPSGTVVPVVPLSAGPTRMIQHFRVPRGRSTVEPLQSLGGRWIQVRLRGEAAAIHNVSFEERDLLGPPIGCFECGDPLLERIWQVGVDTMRSSTEDSIVDSVRERGEWLGDVATAALEILAVSHGDLRPVRRALLHAAASARDDGLVAGCGPGELLYLGTYAAQWMSSCLRYAELSGSKAILHDFFEHASANMYALANLVGEDGSTPDLPWPFVDWGYSQEDPSLPDLVVLLHIHAAAQDWARWQQAVGRPDPRDRSGRNLATIRQIVDRLLSNRPVETLGYHAAVLASHHGLVSPGSVADSIQRHIDAAFPFDPHGARLRSPTEASARVVTPYFMNYSLPVLIKAGRVKVVQDYWRRGWGWMLDRGATTWWEVFDDRWSHCHFWSGAPTWQMSRNLLGLWPALVDDAPALRVCVTPGDLERADGVVPTPFGHVTVTWRLVDDEIRMHLDSGEGELRLLDRNGETSTRRRCTLNLRQTAKRGVFTI